MSNNSELTEDELSQDIQRFLVTDHFAQRMPGNTARYAELLSKFLTENYQVSRLT